MSAFWQLMASFKLFALLIWKGDAVSAWLRQDGAVSGYLRQDTSAAVESLIQSSVVNGTIVSTPSVTYPFFALPTQGRGTDKWLGCGASIISPTVGLSSAHCFGGGNSPCTGPAEFSLWIGDITLDPDTFEITAQSGADKRSVKVDVTLTCHSSWDGKCSHGSDLALLKFSTALPDWVQPVPVFLGEQSSSGLDASDATVKTLGFGNKELPGDATTVGNASPDLRHAEVTVLPQDSTDCSRVYAGGYGCSDDASEAPATNKNQQICAGSTAFRDSCAGDSGSPLVAGDGTSANPFVQVGIVSYGGGPNSPKSGPGRECGDPSWPGIYARTSGLSSFICEHVTDMANYAAKCPSSSSPTSSPSPSTIVLTKVTTLDEPM